MLYIENVAVLSKYEIIFKTVLDRSLLPSLASIQTLSWDTSIKFGFLQNVLEQRFCLTSTVHLCIRSLEEWTLM